MSALSSVCATVVSLLFFTGFALAIIKFLCESTNLCKKRSFCGNAQLVAESKKKKTPYAKIILFSVGVRAFVMLAGFFICMIFQSEHAFNMDAFLTMWHKWDSTGYTNMAKVGYSFLEDGENILLVFFPLYSLCMRFAAFFIRDYYISGVLVSVVFYIAAMVYVYKLAALEFSEGTAWKAVMLISVFPFSFFFGSIHTESITLFMMAAAFYYIRRHNWPLVCVFGILSALCRMVGSLVAVAAFVEYLRFYRPLSALRERNYSKFWKDIATKFVYIPFIAVGGLIYLGINYRISGNPFQFLIYQESVWHNHTQFLPLTLKSLFQWTFGSLDTLAGCIWLPEIVLLILVSLLMIFRWKRLPSMYGIFMGFYISISYAASTLLSAGRYLSIAFPFFLLLADWTEEKEKRYSMIVAASAIFMGIYLTAFLLNKQVM